jgi:acetyltransferase-like isoleucine patch superfamily enzyme
VPTELLIIGTGGMAREAAQLARQVDPYAINWSNISFVTEHVDELGHRYAYGDVRFTDEDLMARTEPADVVIGIGHPLIRRAVARRLLPLNYLSFPNLVHPSVDIDGSCVRMGKGNVVTKGVVLTCDITIGSFNILNWNVTIGHDVSIGSYNVINPACNVSGHVTVADACLIGTGSQILERRTVCDGVVIGAGAVVAQSLTAEGTYVGIPAKMLAC